MGFFSLLAALFIEQLRPLAYQSVIRRPFSRVVEFLRSFSGTHDDYAALVIGLVVVPGLVVLVGVVYLSLYSASPLLAWIWNVAILYLTMGFRQFSHYYSDIQLALRMEDIEEARQLLDEWNGSPTGCQSASEIAKKSIEKALVSSHRHVFGVLAWFVLLPGPCGAVLYRAAACFRDVVEDHDHQEDDPFVFFAQKAFFFIDWIPKRLTAIGYAVVGNFEEAHYCWRNLDKEEAAKEDRIVLASGSGALGISLGETKNNEDEEEAEPINVSHMQSTVGLLWRTLVLWLLFLLLLSFARLTTG